ncbi:methyl-accepting chemotaxis protein [Methylobacillus flagellatus]|uniref:Methyl-accepting chemotaxis sensory transducer n=1 Tax=Methylobacillus flagellatus (strain ATCC 51484 / DSM 6875 / VKM B-1610 / KT) TaxID=265072 RepID=Q1GZB6_METFK|nr:methyl-accepting chemotaxis protein [Methylobacillus flagellatus]ABE50421.1 methyl-accepting chemotaxis sensory transducer [Methylobacillus flagellatus KT]
MKFSDLRIGVRLGAGFAVILLLMMIMVAFGLAQLANVGSTAKQVVETELKKERITTEWVSNATQNGLRTLAAIKSSDAAMYDMYIQQIAETARANDSLKQQLETLLVKPEGKAKFADAKEKADAFSKVRSELLQLRKDGAEASLIEKNVQEVFLPARKAYFDSMNELLEFERHLIDEAGADIQRVKNAASLWMLVIGLVAVVLGAIFAWRLSLGITRPLANAVKLAETVAAGDLTSTLAIDSKDEIGQLLNALKSMNDNLARIVSEVRSGTETIATASSQIASGNLDLSSRTEEQASSLEETASAMEELTSTVKQNADNAQQANQLAVSASGIATQGGEVVDQVIATMQSISESSKRIADIIGVIDGIAFQTNILALNAAVEAARAGEQGRGFAVVASEVRNLAQRSANAAKEIKGLITDSVESVDAGSRLVEQAGTTMKHVVDSVQRVTDIVSEISAASHEQSTGIEQVNQAIVQMDEVTQQNAALVEEAAAASQSLQDQAASLAQAVSVFKVNGMQVQAAVHKVSKPKPVAVSKPKVVVASKPVTTTRTRTAMVPAVAGSADEWEEF